MRFSTEWRFRKYVKGFKFLWFAKNLGDRFGKKLMDAGIDTTKIALKRVVQKTTESTGYLIESKIADKITSVGKSKDKTKKQKNFILHQKKDSKLLMTLNHFG